MRVWLLISFVIILSGAKGEIPIAHCSLNDTDLSICLEDTFIKYLPILAREGIPELDIDPLDPVVFPSVRVKMGSKLITGALELRKPRVAVLKNTLLRKISVKVEDMTRIVFDSTTFHPKMVLEGPYDGRMQIIILKFNGIGQYKITLNDVKINVKIEAHLKEINNKDHFHIDKVKIRPEIDHLKIDFTNELEDNAKIGKTFMQAVNNLWRQYYDELLPRLKPHIEQFVKNELNKYARLIPVDKILVGA